MTIRKTEYKIQRRMRKTLEYYRERLKCCPNLKCRARNSPNAKVCWKCGGDLTERLPAEKTDSV